MQRSKKYLLLILFTPVIIACKQKKEQPDSLNNATVVGAEEGSVINPTDAAVIDTFKKSLKAYASGKIGPASLHISYYSPAVRGRIIWGGLVPYGQVWVTGAHNATSLETNTDLLIGGNKLSAGKYALFTIPGEKEWIFIVNKNWQQHLADNYRESEDILRMKVKPDSLTTKQERLMYQFTSTGENEGNIEMHWENIRLVVPVKVLSME